MGRIIWIASYPKSGNTWTRAFLHNLFTGSATSHDINRMNQISANEAGILNYEPFDPRPWQEWTTEDVSKMRPRVQAYIASTQPRHIFCKTHLAVMMAYGTPTINMDVTAGGIYLVRNPLDVAPSYSDHQGLSMDNAIEALNLSKHETPTTERMVAEPMGNWSENLESWTGQPNPGLHVMRYEDMLADPLKAFDAMVKFLNINVTRQKLRRAVKNSSFKALKRQEEKNGFWEKTAVQKSFFRKGRAGGWKGVLTDKQVGRIIDTHRVQMERFNYIPDGW